MQTTISPDQERIARALRHGHTIDITTIGRRTGLPRRIETVFHNIDGRVILSGLPGPRSWYANLLANPDFTFHLKGPIQADLPARARAVVEPVERRRVMEAVTRNWNASDRLETFMAHSPLVEVSFPPAG